MNHKVYERALATCVVMLLLSILLKVFGVPMILDTNLPILRSLDNIVMNSIVLSFTYSTLLRFINGCLICMIVTRNTKFSKVGLLVFCILSVCVNYYCSGATSFIFDTVGLYLVCRGNVKEYSLCAFINILYQMLSLVIRGLSIQCGYYGLVVSMILNLDYYILLVITYLYLTKGDTSLCSIVHHFGSFLASKLCRKHSNESSRNK